MPEGFCDQCNGKCCTEFTVYITHMDAKRLMDFTGWNPTTFITPYGDDNRSTYPLLKMGEYDVRLGITYTDKKCVFLKVDGETRRCTVQAHKPMVCRTYPFSLNEKGELVHVKPYKCPGPVWPQSQEEREKTAREIDQLNREYREYEEIVQKWNRLPEDRRTDLPDFLDLAFSISQG